MNIIIPMIIVKSNLIVPIYTITYFKLYSLHITYAYSAASRSILFHFLEWQSIIYQSTAT